MRALVVGGSGSGKSAYAERLACDLSPRRTYLATMDSNGAEARARIERHRRQRAGRGFATIECTCSVLTCVPTHVTDGVVLVEDLGNLVANALFLQDGTMADPHEVLDRLDSELDLLADAWEHVVVVGNEAGSEGRPSHETTLAWVRVVGALCCRLAARLDMVVEVVGGIPLVVKGHA